MKGLENIIAKINEDIANGLGAPKFAGKQIYGLTERYEQRNGVVAPCVINSQGKVEPIFLNEKCPLIIYHKLNGVVYKDNTSNSFGSGYTQAEFNSLSLVVFAMRNRINMGPAELEALIATLIPTAYSKLFKTTLALKSLNTTLESCNHNTEAVFSKEWVGVESAIPSSAIILELRYNIGSTYKTACLVNCC